MQTAHRRPRRTRRTVAAALAAALLLGALPSAADDYDPETSGHPLRVLAYVLHPVGVLLDYVLFRPAHWLGSHEPLATLFGHQDDSGL